MDESYEVLELTPAMGTEGTYSEAVMQYFRSLDLSNQSTHVQLGIGAATGWFTGAMVGKVGKVLAAALGGSILLINMGTRAGYVSVDWDRIEVDMQCAGERITQRLIEEHENDRTRRFAEHFSVFVRRNVVTAGGFAAGFFLGMAS